MKNIVFLMLVFVIQKGITQIKNPFNELKGNPISYIEEFYKLKNKNDSKNIGKAVSVNTFYKMFDPERLEQYQEKSKVDSIVFVRNKDNQIIKMQKYAVYSATNIKKSDWFEYTYNAKQQLTSITGYRPPFLKDKQPEVTSLFSYEYTKDRNIKSITKRHPKTKNIRKLIEYTYKNGVPIKKTEKNYSVSSQKLAQQSFEKYKYNANGNCIQKTEQFYNNILRRKNEYNSDNILVKSENYISAIAPKNTEFTEENITKNMQLQDTNYYKKFDSKGNFTEVIIEVPNKDEPKYFFVKRTYQYE